jgi:hypothetical protein
MGAYDLWSDMVLELGDRMSKLKFTPEDFAPCASLILKDADELAAKICNAKLEQWISEQPVVYGKLDYRMHSFCGDIDLKYYKDGSSATHTARLCFIEEMPKKKCEHRAKEAIFTVEQHGSFNWLQPVCAKCGVNIKATWSEV